MGQQHVDVPVGSTVRLHATAHAPAGTGKFVSVEWDLDDDSTFALRHSVDPTDSIDVEHTRRYETAGVGECRRSASGVLGASFSR